MSSSARFREVFKLIYMLRQRNRGRTRSRDIRDTLRLAFLARELIGTYIEVVEWRENRALRLKR
jgi:hypothetical protein